MDGLETYRGAHAGESILVCGLGASLNDVVVPPELTTIGVNDIGRRLTPRYLVVLNREDQFTPERFQWIRKSEAEAVFTCLDLDLPHPRVVRFDLGEYGGTDLSAEGRLPYVKNSPYVAVCLALLMGARRIGIVGVDFTDDHFFARSGPHPLLRDIWQINREYSRLYQAARRAGVELLNLGMRSRIEAIPKTEMAHFLDEGPSAEVRRTEEPVLEVVSYATTPIAGVPAILARCMSRVPAVRARCVWQHRTYSNGVSFEGDVQWSEAPGEAAKLLERADVVVVHNGKVDRRHVDLLRGRPVVILAHNYIWNVDTRLVELGFPGLVVGQYQATLDEFGAWSVVPNPVPIWEPEFSPEPKGDKVTICFTPSGRHDRYPRDHRLYWHSKGYSTTMRALDGLARRHDVRLEVLRGAPVPHASAMAMKRRAHIVIDECVTGSYHRSSLEGLATGCVVVNGIGLRPAVARALAACAGTRESPFVHATVEGLDSILLRLVDRGAEQLAEDGRAGRAWMERHWRFEDQWPRFWAPALTTARSTHMDRSAVA